MSLALLYMVQKNLHDKLPPRKTVMELRHRVLFWNYHLEQIRFPQWLAVKDWQIAEWLWKSAALRRIWLNFPGNKTRRQKPNHRPFTATATRKTTRSSSASTCTSSIYSGNTGLQVGPEISAWRKWIWMTTNSRNKTARHNSWRCGIHGVKLWNRKRKRNAIRRERRCS